MRPRGGSVGRRWPDLLFVGVLLLTLGIPVVRTATHHAAAAAGGTSSGGSGGSQGGGSSGGGTGGGTGATPAPSSSSGARSGGTSNGTSNSGTSNGGTSNSGSSSGSGGSSGDAPRPDPGATSAAETVGTDVVTTLQALPPFLLLYCVLGAFGEASAVPDGIPRETAETCANVTADTGGGSGLSSDSRQKVTATTVIRIRVEQPLPGQSRPHVVVSVPSRDTVDNHVRTTLAVIAAVLLALVATGLVLERRRRRRGGPDTGRAA